MSNQNLEALLFASAKPLSLKQLASLLLMPIEDVRQAVAELTEARNTAESGIHVLVHGETVQFVTNPELAEIVKRLSKEDAGELTRPSLETLTVIAYRGPMTRPELEAIRGVQCALILRNLLTRGLIEEKDDARRGEPVYTLSTDSLRYLGVHSLEELPDYEAFKGDARISKLVDALESYDG